MDWGLENEDVGTNFAAVFAVAWPSLWVNHLNASEGYSGGNTITVIGEITLISLIKQFEEGPGIKVVYETFDSNESMLVKIQQGHFCMMCTV